MPARLEGVFQHNWARAMSLLRSAQHSVSSFAQRTCQIPDFGLVQSESVDSDSTQPESSAEYLADKGVPTQVLCRAWQQVSQVAQGVMSRVSSTASNSGLTEAGNTAGQALSSAAQQTVDTDIQSVSDLSTAASDQLTAATIGLDGAASLPSEVLLSDLGLFQVSAA